MPSQLRLPASSTRYDYVGLTGGLDLLTPTLQLKPGYVRDAINWELSVTGGYSRAGGYERYDGHQAFPSIATYDTITVTITGAIAVGNAIVGGTSAATGTVVSIDTSTGASVIAYTQQTGSFIVGEAVKVAAVTQGTITALDEAGTAASYNVATRALAANVYRALIAAVPGSGITRGVAKLNGVLYAWRDNGGATAMAIYKATSAGWVLVPLLFELAFTAGGTAYPVGSTVTQGGVSATVKQVALQSGAWGGTAVGRLIITAPSGGNFAAGAIAGGGTATASGIQTAITIPPGGHVQTDLGNFGGVVKLYGCDGVGRGFEFDGVTYAPIVTANSPDIPRTVMIHKDHVFFGFDTNYQHSGITTPFNWTALAGSAAYRVNDTITVMLRQPGDQSSGAASISTKTATYMHYGSSAANFNSVPFEESAGARAYSGQRLGGQSLVFANLGVFSLSVTQAFGNFTPASMTLKIRPFTEERKELCVGSAIDRKKSQYRLFFSNGDGLYLTVVNGRLLGSLPVNFTHPVTCCVSQGGDIDGKDSTFFGGANGFVYQLDAGTSHDGEVIQSYFTLTYANEGNSRVEKRYRGCAFEVQGTSYATFQVTYELGYGGHGRVQGSDARNAVAELTSAFWDSGFTFDLFTFDGGGISPSHVEMRGIGENVSLRIESNSDAYDPFTLNSAIIHYTPRKALKK